MRKYAILKEALPLNNYGQMVRKVMVYQTKKQGVFFFLFSTIEDEGCSADYHFSDMADADECGFEYGVAPEDWIIIVDPLPGCRHDLIQSVPIKLPGKAK